MGAFYTIALFWLLVHGAQAYHEHNPRVASLLPSSVRRARPQWLSRFCWGKTEVSIRPFHISVSSLQMSDGNGPLAKRLRSSRPWMAWMTRMYDAGIAICVVGQAAAIILLALAVVYLFIPVVQASPPLTSQSHLARRVEETVSTLVPTGDKGFMFLKPIIPGVTVPVWHVWFLLPALLIAQVIHEAGHFITAILYSVSVHNIGASLILVLPAAFVALDEFSMNSRRNIERLRIIAAGAFHNIACYALLLSCTWLRLGSITLKALGYSNVSQSGLVVIGIELNSGLAWYLDPGSIVIQLDDTSLVDTSLSGDTQDTWARYLLESHDRTDALGWCLEYSSYQDQSSSCCQPRGQGQRSNLSETALSCFVSVSDISSKQDVGHCLDPVPILTPSDQNVNLARCRRDSECSNHRACMILAPKEQLMRITFITPSWSSVGDERRVILWDGPRDEVFEQVIVGPYMPRYSWLPLSFPSWMSLFFEYLKLISVSLYFFNLLPLPFLDGSQFLSTLLDRVLTDESMRQEDHTLDSVEAAQDSRCSLPIYSPRATTRQVWKRRIEMFASRGTMGLTGLGVVLGMWSRLRSL